ncbi:MAG: hypothetical protein NWR43_03700 [Alphaproteobacteria bacterium]|nr:hypothetical protein [Alphaproteobacteria bacterium]
MKEKIIVYTTKRCPYCDASKTLLQRKGYPYSEVDVSDPLLRMMLVKKAQGRKTVPQIFSIFLSPFPQPSPNLMNFCYKRTYNCSLKQI